MTAADSSAPLPAEPQHIHTHGEDHEHRDLASSEKKIDATIIAVLVGGTTLIAAVICEYMLELSDQASVLAAIASILLGGPIVYGAGKSLITGRCSHDHGDDDHHHHHDEACDHDHDHAHDHGKDEIVEGGSHMEELVALAILASFASGQYMECGAVAFFMLISSGIEHRTAVGAREMIESLIRITPTRARRIEEGQEVEVEAAQLREGDLVRVRPGDQIPADGQIRKGMSTINQANITGESIPVEKSEGDEVFSGTINETGVIEIEVTRAGQDSTLGKVQELILQAASSRPAVIRMLDRYAGFYTPVVLMLAAIVFFFTRDLNDAISLLLIACPCAIILAAPTGMVAALSAASRLGVYVKNVGDLEIARRISAIVFDKTGTLTVGELEVSRLYPAEGVEGADLLRVAAAIEHNSKHPVAKAVVRMANKANLDLEEVNGFEEVAGRGVKATLGGSQVLVGREAWVQEMGVDVSALDNTEGEGMSLLYVAKDGQPMGWIGLADKIRAGASESMDELEELGIKRRVMITGDRWSPARKVAREIHVTDVEAEALPGDKLELVNSLKRQGHTVLVIGDGVNDGPALAAGDVSIAMGAAGSDVAIHSASVALMNNNLNRIPFLVALSRRTVSVIRQNLLGTLIYIIAMLALLAAGLMTPLVAAIGHGVSSLIVIFNSARLVREGEAVIDHARVEPRQEQQRRVRVESMRPATA